MSWEQGDLPVQAGTGQPRVCGCFHLRGAEVSMRTSPPLAVTPPGVEDPEFLSGQVTVRRGETQA